MEHAWGYSKLLVNREAIRQVNQYDWTWLANVSHIVFCHIVLADNLYYTIREVKSQHPSITGSSEWISLYLVVFILCHWKDIQNGHIITLCIIHIDTFISNEPQVFWKREELGHASHAYHRA